MYRRNLSNFCDVLQLVYHLHYITLSYIRIAINYIMEQRQIKATKKKYFNKKLNQDIVKFNLYINLGVNTDLKKDETVIILTDKEYKELINNNGNKEINNLNETIKELNNNINNVTADNQQLQDINTDLNNTVANLETEITELNNLIQQKETELSKYNAIDIETINTKLNELETNNKELETLINSKNDDIIYLMELKGELKQLINLYESKGVINSILRAVGLSDIDETQFNLIDKHGNQLKEVEAPIIPTINKSDIISE